MTLLVNAQRDVRGLPAGTLSGRRPRPGNRELSQQLPDCARSVRAQLADPRGPNALFVDRANSGDPESVTAPTN
jgi:hypothetical protein